MFGAHSQLHDPKLKRLVMSCGDTSPFRNTDVPYFTLRNWVREGRTKKMTAAELLECRNIELIALVLKLRVKYGALATANHLLKT